MHGNLHSNYEKIINYIYDNVRYGTEISNTQVNFLFVKHPVTDRVKWQIYDELDLLNVKVTESSVAEDDLLFKLHHLANDQHHIVCTQLIAIFEQTKISTKAQNKIKSELNNWGFKIIDDPPKVESSTAPAPIAPQLDVDDDFEDLDELLESESFSDEVKHSKDAIDKKYNLDYVAEAQSGDEEYRALGLDNLVKANKRLVWKIAVQYKKFSTSSFDVDDMYQAGVLGLLKAVDRFDASLGNQFSTYATWWIRQSIIRAIEDYSLTIRVPVHMRERIIKLTKLERDYENNHLDPIDDEYLANKLELNPKEIKQLRIYRDRFRLPGLDMPIGEAGDTTLQDLIQDIDVPSPEQIVIAEDLKTSIEKTMHTLLKPKEQQVVSLRFGLDDDHERTLEEIGHVMGVTRERIRQIEKKALTKLQKSQKMEDYHYDFD